MTKIYKDADNKYVAATVIYWNKGNSANAFKDKEFTTIFTSEELAKAVLNGCIIVDGNSDEPIGSPKTPYYIPIGTEAQVVEGGAITRSMSIVFLEPYEDGDETLTSITTLTADDPQ